MAIRRRVRVGLVFFLMLGGMSTATWAVAHNRINSIQLSRQGEFVVVEIAGEQAPNFTTFKQDAPRRVIVDVAECDLSGAPGRIQGDGNLVTGITTEQFGTYPRSIARVIIQLASEAEYKVTIRGGTLFVHLSPGTGGLLVSAGVPVGPDRPRPVEPVVAATSSPASIPPVHDTGDPVRAEEPPPGPAVVARTLPSPSGTRLPEPDREVEPEPEPTAPSASPAGPRPEPVRVAMLTPKPQPEPDLALPQPEPAPPVVAQEEEEEVEESDEVPVEVVEEVEEVPEIPGEEATEEIPPPPPEADAAGEAAEEEEEAVPPPPPPATTEEEAVPMPPDVTGEEVVPPPPPVEEETESAVPMPPPPEEAVPPPPAYSEVEERVEISGAVKHMTWVGFQQTKQTSRVFIKTTGPVEYRVTEEGQNLVVLELENTTIPVRNNRRFLDTHFFDSAVTMIVPREVGGISRSVRVEIQLKNKVPFRAGREDNLVYVSFDRPQ